jgi:hypothetical protein
VGEDDTGIGDQAAPIAGMMRAVAQGDAQAEVLQPARAEHHRRPRRVEARPVRRDQHVCGEPVTLRHAEITQAARAHFFVAFK